MERLTKRHSPSSVTLNKLADDRQVLLKLAEYEDAEEQGLLLRLPCKVGSTVYVIDKYCVVNIDNEECESNEVCETCRHYKKYVVCEKVMMQDYCGRFRFGKTAFLTREEAEQALAEMQKG